MKLNLVAIAAVSLIVVSGCATSGVSTIDAADRAAIDRDMPGSGKAWNGAMPTLEASPMPVSLDH